MNSPTISKIRIYPIKSLDPVELMEAEIGMHSLKHDRIFAMIDENGKMINGKRTGKVNQLQASYDLEKGLIHLTPRATQQTETFALQENNKELNNYLQRFFDIPLKLVHNNMGELMDVPKRSCATLVSQASYQSLLDDFPAHTIEEFRLRFRANIEITEVDAFWEETLIQLPDNGVHFKIGDVDMLCTGPRARCNVPPRNPQNGELDKTFIKKFLENRKKNLPEKNVLQQYKNLYYLTVDIFLAKSEAGKKIKVGDTLEIIGAASLPTF